MSVWVSIAQGGARIGSDDLACERSGSSANADDSEHEQNNGSEKE